MHENVKKQHFLISYKCVYKQKLKKKDVLVAYTT